MQEDTSLANQQETQAQELDAVLIQSRHFEKQSNTIFSSLLVVSSVSVLTLGFDVVESGIIGLQASADAKL